MTVSGIAGRVNGVSEEGEEHHEMSSWFDVNRTLGIDSWDKGGRLRETTAGRKTTAILENSLIIGSDFSSYLSLAFRTSFNHPKV